MAATPTQVNHIGDLLSRAHGKILELGPGSGDQMYHYNPGNIEKLYAAEPNTFLHPKLLQMAAKHDLAGKLVPLEAGGQPGSLIPALKEQGLLPNTVSSLPEQGVFDTVVTIKSLCSLPSNQLTATIAVVQALLKPGGQFLFFEHVENNTDSITKSYVWLLEWLWPALMGGCRLNGKIDQVVLGMGGWDERRISTVGDFKGHEVCDILSNTANADIRSYRSFDMSRELRPKLDHTCLGLSPRSLLQQGGTDNMSRLMGHNGSGLVH